MALLFTALVALLTSRHEMWSDELQAWLLARDSVSPLALLANMRYEGHPALWHLLLWAPAHLSWNPVWMQVVHVAVVGVGFALLFRLAPFGWPAKLALAGGYYFLYEWAVMARNYALGVTLLWAFCALYRERWRRFVLLGLVLAALAHTNGMAAIMAAVLLATLVAEFVWRRLRRAPEAAPYGARVLAGIAVAALGLVTAAAQMQPPRDGGFHAGWVTGWDQARARATAHAVANAYMPAPPDDLHYWYRLRAGLLGEVALQPNRLTPGNLALAAAAGWLALGTLMLLSRPWLLLFYLGCSGALLAFFYTKHLGYYRHHGFLFLSFVTAMWLSPAHTPWHPTWPRAAAVLAWWDRQRRKVLLAMLLVPLPATWIAARHEWLDPFSQAAATAAWVRARFGAAGWPDLMGHQSARMPAVIGYLRAERMFYPDRNASGTYVIWDGQRRGATRAQIFERVTAHVAATGRDALVILNVPPAPGLLPLSAQELARFEGAVVEGENYYVYLWLGRASVMGTAADKARR